MERRGPDWGECGTREPDREQVSEGQVQALAEGMVGDTVTAGEVVGVRGAGVGRAFPV